MSNFNMTVSTYPNAKLNLEDDIDLIKIAILYGDKVSLKSIKADLIYRVLDYQKQNNVKEKLLYLKEIAHLGKSDILNEISIALDEYNRLLARTSSDRKKGLLKLRLDKEFGKYWKTFESNVFKTIDMNDINSINSLIKTGKLRLDRYNTSASQIYESDDYIIEYLDSIQKTLSEHNNYPLFDSKVSKMVNLGINEGKLNITEGVQERIKHSNLTMTMLNNLPTFDKAKLNEILDIRTELDPYLLRFRSAVTGYTELIESDITDEDLLYEIDKLIIKEINQAIIDIDEQCKGNHYIRELSHKLVNSKWVQAASVGLILGNVFDLFTVTSSIVTGAVSTGAEITNHHKQWRENKVKIEQNNLFFYYQFR